MLSAVPGYAWRVLVWLVLLVAVAALAVAVLIPRLGGATPYDIETGSMRPHYPPGTLVVIKPIDAARLKVGQVATYQISSGEPEVATHRIVDVTSSLKGARTFTFKGDANPSPDPKAVRAAQLKGRLWYSVPYLGWTNNVVNGRQRQMLIYVVVVLLLGYAGFMFAGVARDRARSSSASPAEHGRIDGVGEEDP